ncbi:hypothetical protein AALA00_02230 [Lachnospiraceae bacterium 46-15]
MSRFKCLNEAYVNVDTISEMEIPFRNDDKCRVDFKDGTHISKTTNQRSYTYEGCLFARCRIRSDRQAPESLRCYYQSHPKMAG